MSKSAGKRRNIYVDPPKSESKTCLIHGPGYSSDEWKVLGDFGSKYVEIRPTKDCGQNPLPRNKFNRHKENSDIVNSALDEALLHENEQLITVKEANENVDSDFDENKLYHIENISLEDTKE